MMEVPATLRFLSARALLLGSGDALENVDPGQLSDGCGCWVIEFQELYFLDKNSTAAVSPPDVIATLNGAGVPGRWLMNATSGPPSGPAGGDLAGNYPNPTVIALEETGGPTRLVLANIADQTLLKRAGSNIAGTVQFAQLFSANDVASDVDQAGTTGGNILSLGLPNVGTWAVWLGASYTLDAGSGPFIQVTLDNPGQQRRLQTLIPDSNTRDISEFLIVVSGGNSRTVTWSTTFGATPGIAAFGSPQALAARIA